MDYEFNSEMPGYYRRAFNRWLTYHYESPGGRDRRFRCAAKCCGSPELTFVLFAKYGSDENTGWYAELTCKDCRSKSYLILSQNSDFGGVTTDWAGFDFYNSNVLGKIERLHETLGL